MKITRRDFMKVAGVVGAAAALAAVQFFGGLRVTAMVDHRLQDAPLLQRGFGVRH